MKKIKFLIFALLIFPIFVSASTYTTEVNKANNLLNKEKYKNTYEKYIVNGGNIKFEYSNNTNKFNSDFRQGGFISMDEYNLTKKNNSSYLFEGIEYWTLSTNGDRVYAITYNDINTAKDKSSNYNGRATEFVKPNVKIHGEGKLNNPWYFDPLYKVTAKVDSKYATIVSGNNQYVKGECNTAECTAKIEITPKEGYQYITNDCNGTYNSSTNILSVNNVKRDTVCNVTFGKGVYVVTLSGGTPNKIYLKHGENYYKDIDLTTVIKKIDSVEPTPGYTFLGYFYNGNKIINGDKEPNPADNKKVLYESVTGKYITKNVTLEQTLEANKYTVTFDCNGGSVAPATQVITYDQVFTLTSSVCQRDGYTQPKWNTKANGTGEDWTVSGHTNEVWKRTENVKLYAVWSECPGGTYSPASSNTCTNCPTGSYCPPKSATPITCPSGYTSDAGVDEQTDCYINVTAGKYIATANTTTQTECANGYYKAAHKVNYGSTSSCTQCPNGYRDGTSITNKTAQNKCLRNVTAGYYIASANAATNTVCANGYYNAAHTVTYGSTSTCTQCPAGYRDGTAVANKTAQNTCLRNVTAGYYIASANATSNTVCANGYYKAAHGVTYGSTSTCTQCPSGYRDGTAVANKTAQNTCLRNVTAGYYIASANATSNTECANGYYKAAHTVTYGSTSSCTQCPAGYRNGTAVANKTAQNTCARSVAAGNYIATANATTNTECANGYYKEAHLVNYGSTSSCTQCPANYRDGTALANKTSQSVCLNNIAAGYRVATANGAETACDTGYYKAAHTVTYGSTSTCTQCPAGYRDGTAVANKTAQNTCLRNVTAGYYIASANATSNTECANGYYKAAHGVTYGSTSSCTQCPAGYRNGTAVANKTAQNTCARSVAAGNYIATANATTNTECANGYYKEAHLVNYGSTSSCTQCPANYRDGTALANKTSQSVCLNNVAAGYRVATANGAETACDTGYYKAAHTVTYGSTSTCTQCPDGYRNGTAIANKTAQNTCARTVAAGYYIATANATSNTVCANGYYKAQHTVTYGSTSSCTQCPAGYRDGTAVANKTAQNTCARSVAAGYYIASANATTNTACANGYYKEAHLVTYGGTSSCTQCPAGYRDGTAVANKTAQNTCARTVAAGYYIAAANATSNTVCANGYYKAQHTVTYGSTSSCTQCPANYRDGTAVANKTAQNTCLNSVAAGYRVATANAAETACDTGYYKAAHTVTYGGTSTCTQCPAGYRDGTAVANKTAQNTCARSVAAGYYIAAANATSNTVCANGYYKAAHLVNYGSTSSCTQCPANYRDGTAVANKTAQNTCLNSVAAGYRVATANGAETACDNGYYKAAHGVTYGSTSTCTQCPAGYRDGTAVANKTAQNTCARTVAAGYYIASANATSNTVCANGYYKAQHTVTYGSTSSCTQCPANYRDGTAVANKTAQNTCLNSVAAGYRVATANGAETACADGYYKEAHGVTYGSTSTCTQCPAGYRDGTAVANKTAQNKCLNKVTANRYVKTANADDIACASGYEHDAHTVTYGNTSSACTRSCDEGVYEYDYCSSTGYRVLSRYNECLGKYESITSGGCTSETVCGSCTCNGSSKTKECTYYTSGVAHTSTQSCGTCSCSCPNGGSPSGDVCVITGSYTIGPKTGIKTCQSNGYWATTTDIISENCRSGYTKTWSCTGYGGLSTPCTPGETASNECSGECTRESTYSCVWK